MRTPPARHGQEPRHVALYVPHIDPRPTGLGVYVDAVCGRLTRRTNEITLFTESPEHVPADWRVTRVVCMPSAKLTRGASRLVARQIWLQGVLPRLISRARVDALFVPFHEGCLVPPCPQFIVIHDLTPLVIPSPYFHPMSQWYLRHVLPKVIQASSTVFAVSEHTKLDMRRSLGVDVDNVRVVAEGYERSIFKLPSASETERIRAKFQLRRPYILYAGTYAEHKNPRLFVDIMCGLRRLGMDTELLLCGRPDAGTLPEVRRAFEENGLSDSVRMLGYVDREDLAALMHAAACFAYPSLYEGFGLAPLEAMAAGAVVIASSAASVPEVVGEGGVLLPPRDADAWVATISRLVSDPSETARLRAAGVARAARFDWDVAVESILRAMAGGGVAAPGESFDRTASGAKPTTTSLDPS